MASQSQNNGLLPSSDIEQHAMTAIPLTRIISAFQIFGAASAATILLSTMSRSEPTVIGLLVFLFGISICAIAFYAGLRLWNGEEFGYIGSFLAQAIQIPVIYLDGVIYKFVLGLGFNVGWADSGYWFTAGWTFLADFIIRFGGSVSPHTIGIIVLPVLILVYLVRQRGALNSGTLSRYESQ